MRIYAKIRNALLMLLSSGLTPHKLALTVAFGVTLGILPVLWGTTLLCVFFAFIFRLNQACIQIVNYLSYPLQLLLLVPFYRLGARLFPPATVHAAAGGGDGMSQYLYQLGGATVRAVAGWLVIAPGLALLLYVVLLPLLRWRLRQEQAQEGCTD